MIGMIWTFAWFSFSLRYTSVHHFNLGIFEKPVLPSIVEGAVQLWGTLSGGKGLPEL